MKRLSYYFLRIVIELFRFLPFPLLYGLSNLLAFVLGRVIGYRRAVLRENLKGAFPGISEEKLRDITRGAYRNLADITLETIKGFTLPMNQLRRRCTHENAELLQSYFERGDSFIVAMTHLNNWEWPCIIMREAVGGQACCVYKPLSNPFVNAYYNARRSRAGTTMISMDETFAAMRRLQGQAAGFFFVSDQSPSSRKSAHWVGFMNRETAFMPGVDFLARRFRYPVLYLHVERLRRGYYKMVFSELFPDPSAATEQAITRAYAAHAEAEIREQPENWLWTHRRWKFVPSPAAQPQD